ncbi:MAG: SPFH domain-containing protein [Bacteroidales bacterium]|nr:SPFH domain-containing protein [Lachnoclostridium sp.]MCM1384144.1 SPFH domain-containing protein [Lachnoclostridium sp.]MCM1464810.1 SPFH domain-containing protein [Bacteroidales bacterium]
MAITYKKFEPTEYVMKVKKGKVVQKGLGLSFFYNTMNTSMMVIPATAFDTSFAFSDILTSDFQNISVQGDISYVITDYEKASKMVDFSYKDKKEYPAVLTDAKQKMAKRIINLAKVYVTKFAREKNVRDAIMAADELAAVLKADMKEDETLNEFGLALISVSILGIIPQSDTRKALEAATREEILKQQDDAIYKRRNAAIEQERIVKENELNTEIKVAEKQKEKREKEMEVKRLVQEKQAELDAQKLANDIRLEEENCRLVDLQTENEKKKSDAKAYDSEVLLKTFTGIDKEVVKALVTSGMDSKALIAKAFMEIGDKADKIGVLNVSPDLLETLTQQS